MLIRPLNQLLIIKWILKIVIGRALYIAENNFIPIIDSINA
jgi:hypothetical protein